jgi:hypothetical protein
MLTMTGVSTDTAIMATTMVITVITTPNLK